MEDDEDIVRVGCEDPREDRAEVRCWESEEERLSGEFSLVDKFSVRVCPSSSSDEDEGLEFGVLRLRGLTQSLVSLDSMVVH